jgi:hypothetical protein
MKRGSLKLFDVSPYQALLDAVPRGWRDVQRGRCMFRDLALASYPGVHRMQAWRGYEGL